MNLKTGMKKLLIAIILIAVIATITLGSGMIAKFFTKASSCNKTKLLLFSTGLVLGLLFIILGALYQKFDTEDNVGKYYKQLKEWSDKEQYRYTLSSTESSGVKYSA
jgi:hypothetical protein